MPYTRLLRGRSEACADPQIAARATRLCVGTERAVGVNDRNAKQLAQGSRKLAGGTRKLANAMPRLESGIDRLGSGSRDLADGGPAGIVSLGGVIPVDTAPAPLRFLNAVLPMPQAAGGLTATVLDGPGSLRSGSTSATWSRRGSRSTPDASCGRGGGSCVCVFEKCRWPLLA